ncbi:MAG: hypothetical protein HKN70_08860 [Gammaproteobacteria bacterium]|nr:hypothetical protein [Gammaproteobacteria bacterium]
MTEQLKLQVSAYVDDELLDEECELLVHRLCTDDELQETVRRYSLIGDAIRGDNIAVQTLLSRRISLELADDQELADVAMPLLANSASRWRRFIRPVTGIAVAATVATVAVLSLQGPVDHSADGLLPSTTTAQVDAADGGLLAPVTLPPFNGPSVRNASAVPQSRMDKYLIRHRSYASGLGGQSIMGFRDVSNYVVVPLRVETEKTAADKEKNPQ